MNSATLPTRYFGRVRVILNTHNNSSTMDGNYQEQNLYQIDCHYQKENGRHRFHWSVQKSLAKLKRTAVATKYLRMVSIHLCIETLGPRYAASIACLLVCLYHGKGPGKDNRDVRKCERECYDQFMSITPIDIRPIEREATIFPHQHEIECQLKCWSVRNW